MSYRAIVEFILHLEHFRNVDLIQQGLYFMKYELFNEKDDKVYYASPYQYESKDSDADKKDTDGQNKVTFHRLIEPYIVDQSNSFYSKTFFVRYAEELVVLRDIVKFRSEIDVSPGYLDTEFYLKAELFYQPPPQTNFSRCMNSPKDMLVELQKNEEPFKMVQARLYRINKGLMGQSSFLPVLFDREYTCLTMTTVHTSLIDYRFRTLPIKQDSLRNKTLVPGETKIDEIDQTFM